MIPPIIDQVQDDHLPPRFSGAEETFLMCFTIDLEFLYALGNSQLPTLWTLKTPLRLFHAFVFLHAPSSVMDPSNPLTNLTILMFDAERNCTAAGAFAAHIRQFQDDRDSFPLLSLRELVTFCSNATIASTTDRNLVDWYNFIDTTAAEPFENFLIGVQENSCRSNFCRNLEWEGNPD